MTDAWADQLQLVPTGDADNPLAIVPRTLRTVDEQDTEKHILLNDSHCTVIVSTIDGDVTVLKRPQYGVVLVDKTGKAYNGHHLKLWGGRLCLLTAGHHPLYYSHTVVRLYVATN